MDDLERPKCAIEKFEAVLRERTTQRELVSDAMLRLIKLYEQQGDDESVKPILRQFWDVGMKLGSRGHVPWSTRFFPPELDILVNLDVPRIIAAPVSQQLGEEARDIVFTCDDARREEIRSHIRWKRARRKAEQTGRDVNDVVYEELADERKRERERAAAAKKRKSGRKYRDRSPIFIEATCPIARALGQDDLLSWRRMTGALDHRDFGRSMAVAEIPGLDALLADAVAAGRLERLAADRWQLPDFDFHGERVQLASLDHDELLAAPASMMADVVAAREKRTRRINRDLEQLAQRVPRDTGFFVVLTRPALRDLGFGNMKPATRTVLEALLPKPKGMQIAGVFGEFFGVFTRVPTDNPVKGRMLIAIARAVIDGRSEKDPEAEEWLRNLDVAEAGDRQALIASYVLTAAQVEKIMLQ
jgi:hypothetical protein